jgi:hypothetical protein
MSARTAAFPVALALLFTSAAFGIIRRHDREDAQYVALGKKFPAVTQLGGGTATLVDERWLITAAHVVANLSPFDTSVRIGGTRYAIKGLSRHPQSKPQAGPDSFDLALVELAEAVVGVVPVGIYDESDEKGKQVVFVGPGMHGDGLTGPVGEDGQYRGATNTVLGVKEMHIVFRFHAPPDGTDLEGISGPGDSGGPALLEVDGKTFIIGVSSANDDDGAAGPCRYNSTEYYARVSKAADWIRATMKAGAEPVEPTGDIVDLKKDPWPDSRASQVASALIAAFNRGDDASMESFERQFRAESALQERPVEERVQSWKQFRGEWGKLTARKAVAGQGNNFYVLVHAEGDGTWKTFQFQLEADDPFKLIGIGIGSPATPPVD